MRDKLLVSAAELDSILREQSELPATAPRTRVLDVRWSLASPDGRGAYERGHIPGAVYVDLETELSAPGSAALGRHPLPDTEALTSAARRWGLNPGDSVVAYDGSGNLGAARAWWVLRDAGISRVRLLDGALPGWIAAGFELETGPVVPDHGTIMLQCGHLPRLQMSEVAAFAKTRTLVDARAHERFTGASEPIDPQAGHIPGALNLPTSEFLDEGGFFLPSDVLRSRFLDAGVHVPRRDRSGAPSSGTNIEAPDSGCVLNEARPKPNTAIYCGSGITASHALFALALAGDEGALYPGSWSQWSNDPEQPVATGSPAANTSELPVESE